MEGASAPDVPVVDWGDGPGVIAALSTVGFVALREHGVPEADLSAMRQLLVDLFAVDEASKARQAITRENYRGIIPLSFFTPNRWETMHHNRIGRRHLYEISIYAIT